jgi:hypothetical protein
MLLVYKIGYLGRWLGCMFWGKKSVKNVIEGRLWRPDRAGTALNWLPGEGCTAEAEAEAEAPVKAPTPGRQEGS